MTSIWFPNNKYPPNTKNYLPCFVLGGGGLVLGGRDYFLHLFLHDTLAWECCQVLIEEKVKVVETAGRNPEKVIKKCKEPVH